MRACRLSLWLLTLFAIPACAQSNAIDLDADAGDAGLSEDGGAAPEPRLLEQETHDEDCDQLPEEITTIEYDEQGRIAKRTVQATGTPKACQRLVYDDESGLLMKEITDDGCDGIKDECIAYEYDEDGRELARETDNSCDGEIDTSVVHTYDAQGRQETTRVDLLFFSRPIAACERTEYDDEDRPILIESFDCEDGARECSVLAYDDEGRLLTQHSELDCDATMRSNCMANVYGDDGQLAFSTFDGDCDGFPGGSCMRTEYRYDDAGNRVEERVDEGCEGTTDECLAFAYDDAGNRTVASEDRSCDGVRETCTTYRYQP